jgi:hypothetical protein
MAITDTGLPREACSANIPHSTLWTTQPVTMMHEHSNILPNQKESWTTPIKYIDTEPSVHGDTPFRMRGRS